MNTRIFSESKVGVIYGSAGVGKSTLINHVSHYLNDDAKLYLTQTNPAKENLMRKIDAENTTFSTIESFKRQVSTFAKYKLLVIDECSTVSNKDMVEVLQKANFEMLLLVGDTYQIDAIQFGNWFSVLKAFLPESAVFELTQPHRTKDERLLELWDKVRQMDDTAKEVIERESYSLKVDESLLSSLEPGEAILCLNYDGLYGINNINRFLQESNPNPVKIVITDEVEELVTHNIFYTAITRAREKLKIYWTPEVEEKVINRIKPRDISKDVELRQKIKS